MARRLARLRSLTPAFSVEGLRTRTDRRRGKGIFDRVVESMARMREAGVPYGISVTVTRDNIQEIISDESLNFFFHELGAYYAFYFQYLPIGRNADFENMPSPNERLFFRQRSWEVIVRQRFPIFDFWNHGSLVGGCIAAGRDSGLYIDGSGDVTPCVFFPYVAGNVHETYAKGGTLKDIWKAPLLGEERSWQKAYSGAKGRPKPEGNWLAPCPFRDHPELMTG